MERLTLVTPVHEENMMTWPNSQSPSPSDSPRDDALFPGTPASNATAWMNSNSSSNGTWPTGPLSPVSSSIELTNFAKSTSTRFRAVAESSDSRERSGRNGCSLDTQSLPDQNQQVSELIPKLEPLDDDFNLEDVQEAPLPPPGTQTTTTHGHAKSNDKPKRPRGRPRKHPLAPTVNASKITKGRSKTGCITCRKRKKKCDEAKPRCMNCEKNAVVCEGYHEKKLWKSGKEKAVEDVAVNEDTVIFTMQPLFHGVVSVEDKVFWKHYYANLSNVLTVEGETKNAFKDIILPLANQHQGVMHSILAMSSKHIDFETPYGAKLLQQNTATNQQALELRAAYHHEKALASFYADIQVSSDKDHAGHSTILNARYAQILCLLVGTLIEGNSRGDHRVHLKGYQHLMRDSPPEDPVFSAFIAEFFQYHIYADTLNWRPDIDGYQQFAWSSLVPMNSPRLLGVADGLLEHLVEIAKIRETVRRNIRQGTERKVDYPLLWRAQEIQEAIETWNPHWPLNDSRHRGGLVYKHMMFLHLFRTIYPPTDMCRITTTKPAPSHPAAPVSPADSRRPSQASRPVTASSSASSPHLRPATASAASTTFQQHSPPGSRNPSRTSSTHESDIALGPKDNVSVSPTSGRRTSQQDSRITAAVEESLTMMEGFKPSDPALRLLLMPCQIIGAACFEPSQQERLAGILRQVRGYTGLANCDRVSELLAEVWQLMEREEWLAAWDWQGVSRRKNLDFLCT